MTKRLEYGPQVQIALRGLDPEGVRRLEAWFGYLRHADTDPIVRDNSVPLPGHDGVFVLHTTTDLRIFYRIDGDAVTVLQVATMPTILASAGLGNGGAGVSHEVPQTTK